MTLKKIPSRKFQEIHDSFKGEFFEICARCGGKCEIFCISTLLPGEKEFIAKYLVEPVKEVEDKYLDKLVTPLGSVDVLKLIDEVLFLIF